MNISDLFQQKIPLVKQWINMTLAAYASHARPVLGYGFQEIPKHFSQETLSSANVVLVEKVPMPPLSQMGLSQLGDFEKGNYAGVTYLDTYFLVTREARNESIHFHELCHIVQWKYLGVDDFLKAYATGLLQYGYRNSPLEVMAYEYQQLFEKRIAPFNIEKQIIDKLAVV
jgi:hypothetical protein